MIASRYFICGKIASLIDLQMSSRDDLKAILTFGKESLSESYLVDPKESVQFMTVFYNPPENAYDFGLGVVKVSSP